MPEESELTETMASPPVAAEAEAERTAILVREAEQVVAPPAPEKPPVTKFGIRNLDFYYGKNQALKGITVDLYQHEVTALIGPSGCGKSTFLRCLNRMNEVVADVTTNGEILLDGTDINDRKVDVVELRKRVGMVFQRPNPFPKSIYDNVAYGPRIHGATQRGLLD